MSKAIIHKNELEPKILSGLEKIAGIVKRTLGPGGLAIIIQRLGQDLRGEPLGPKITKDGVSVANECASTDEVEDLVIQAVKHICRKTNAIAGDGTTTAIVLGEAIVMEMLKVLAENPGLNPQLVKLAVEEEAAKVIARLKKLAQPIKNMNMVRQIATISSNGDAEIGNMLGDAFEKVGAEGVVVIDEGSTTKVTLEVVEGYQFDKGAEAQARFFNNKNKTKFEAENARIVIFDGPLYEYTDVVNVIKVVYGLDEQGKPTKPVVPIVFLANEFSQEVIQFLLIQKAEAGLTLCAIRGPHVTTVRSGYYDDIAVLTNGARLGNGSKALSAVSEADIGSVGTILTDKYKTTLYNGAGDETAIIKMVDHLKALKLEAESPYDAQIIGDRIGALTGGIAKIGVGGSTEFEIKEKYDRMEDALNASRAAIEEGIIAGGGMALARIADTLGESIGQKILAKALRAPLLQILENIGATLSEDQLKILAKDSTLVFDGKTKQIVNYLEEGIIDPVKVTRIALENAVSIASLLSTAGGGIYYKNQG